MRLPFPNHCIQLVQVMLHFVDQLIQHFVCLFCLFFNGPGIRLLDGRFLGMPLFFQMLSSGTDVRQEMMPTDRPAKPAKRVIPLRNDHAVLKVPIFASQQRCGGIGRDQILCNKRNKAPNAFGNMNAFCIDAA